IYPNRSGSNLQAGVHAARKELEADDQVTNDNKYMIILTDAAARMWINEKEEPVTNAVEANNKEIIWWNKNNDFVYFRYTSSDYPRFEEVWNRAENTENPENPDKYAVTLSEWKDLIARRNAGEDWDTLGVARLSVVRDKTSDYFTTYEAATYHAGKEILAAADSGMNVKMVTYPYHSGTAYGNYIESFKEWLSQRNNIERYDFINTGDEETDEENSKKIFEDIRDELIYLVDKGSVVVDEIGKTDDYDFSFINKLDTLKLTVNGVEYVKEQLDETSYKFSAEGKEGFVLTYYPEGTTVEGKEYGECFVLNINQAITYDDPVQLTYSVHLDNPKTEDGEYGVYDEKGKAGEKELYTNNVATLYPVDTKGNEGEPEDFPLPTVSYKITSISGTKTWEDDDDRDGVRPEFIFVELLKNGNPIDKIKVGPDDEGNWTYKFSGLRLLWTGESFEDEGIYTVREVLQEGSKYTSKVEGSEITNTHETEKVTVSVEKKWEDEDNKYNSRPESLKVELKADGKQVATAELNAENNWKYTFESTEEAPLYKFKEHGKTVTYTVDEVEVPVGYKKSVEKVSDYSFAITNTYKPIEYDPPVVKHVLGDVAKANKDETFTFKFEAVTEGAPMPEGSKDGVKTITVKAEEDYEFGTMYLTKPGEYTYKITEVNEGKKGYIYTDKAYELTFTVYTEDKADSEQLKCRLTVDGERVDLDGQKPYVFEFVNTYRELVDIEIEKVWADNNNAEKKRPEKIEVTLYANNEELGTFELSEKTEWKLVLGDLTYSDEEGREIKYTVKENKVPEGYKATVKQDGHKVIITNSMKTPATGDNSNLTLWLTLLGISTVGTAGFAVVTAKKKKED
ncbi:MAG: Cna B-type domain-containing protein, partial [Erysipelotrichaceae bacterium]|nr:Cna B-type domain-containing protein [Erysipelotrichaceae bacterium]